ncbi:helix-turn-helix domain-containing protein [Moraxella sp. Pampa]|uniref:helix-turn-helix domain-containing protein n=1 Tax=Moraxella sp. Pampa TaxID=3111978 RepID=UPI002B415082|nr:helix-turn-helix domain-containing protein [Moraxella sp. Pampa]
MFGTRLKEERARLNLTQPQFAEKIGVSKRTVVDWEQEKSSPTIKQLGLMIEMGMEAYYLLNDFRIGRTIGDLKQLPAYQEMMSVDETMTAQSADEQELLRRFRNADPQTQAFIMKELEL